MDPRFIDDLAKKLSAAVPQGIANVKRDLEDNFKSVLQSALSRMDLVTRQEFDVQAGVLRRTREKVDALEAKHAGLAFGDLSGHRALSTVRATSKTRAFGYGSTIHR